MIQLLVLAALALQEPQVDRVELHFEGNASISASDLRRAAVDELLDLERRGFRRAEVDDAAFVMEEAYRDQGFPFARVRYRYEIRGRVLHATFVVAEGDRCLLGGVRVEGVSFFPEESVRSLFQPSGAATPYVAARVAGALSTLRGWYRNQGFTEARVTLLETRFSEDRRVARIRIAVVEGTRYRITEAILEGDGGALEAGAWRTLREELLGMPYLPRVPVELRLRLVEAMRLRGHADARASVEARPVAGGPPGAMALAVLLEPGPRVRVGGITILGNERTAGRFIRRRLVLEAGGPWTLGAERESFRRLFLTGLFRKVKLELEGQGEERTLRVEVEEAPARDVEIAPGWGSYEQARIELAFRDRNFLGTGRAVRLEQAVSMVGWETVAGFTDPWLFGEVFELDVPVFWRRRREPSFTGEEYGLALQMRRPLSQDLSLTWGWQFRRSTVRSTSAAGITKVPLTDARVATLSVEPRWDSRNDRFNPTAGTLAFARGELSKDVLGSDLELLRLRFQTARYLSLAEEDATVLALGARTGVVFPIAGTQAVPIQERFFAGGQDTVRGFEEGEMGPLDRNGLPVGGETFTVLNAELRRRLHGSLHGAVFVDVGNVGFDTGNWAAGWRWGTGLGLRYLLPVGAVRLDLGINPDRRPGEEPWVLYLAVGMAF